MSTGWVLLHGTPLTPEVWTNVAAALPAPAAVPAAGPEATDDQANLQRAVARRLLATPAEPVHLVGHSFGGQIALEMVLAAPERVASLTILCSRATPFVPFVAAADHLRAGGPVDIDAALSRWFRPPELAANGPVVQYARRVLGTADRALWADALDAIGRYDRLSELAQIAVPTTLIAAGYDVVSTPDAMRETAAAIEGSDFHVLADAAHMSPFTDPAKLAGLLVAAANRAT